MIYMLDTNISSTLSKIGLQVENSIRLMTSTGINADIAPFLVYLKACFKSWKLCKDCERGEGFKASLNHGCDKTAAHKRKLHIMAVMHSYA
jgi:hypothetical protein